MAHLLGVADPLGRVRADSFALGGRVEEPPQADGDGRGVVGDGHKLSLRITIFFAWAGKPMERSENGRQSATHRLHHRTRESFLERGKGEEVGGAVVVLHVGDLAGERYAPWTGEGRDGTADRFGVVR